MASIPQTVPKLIQALRTGPFTSCGAAVVALELWLVVHPCLVLLLWEVVPVRGLCSQCEEASSPQAAS